MHAPVEVLWCRYPEDGKVSHINFASPTNEPGTEGRLSHPVWGISIFCKCTQVQVLVLPDVEFLCGSHLACTYDYGSTAVRVDT